MRMKQIQAPSMQEAMQIARRDLGEDAIMLRSDKKGGNVIVTFGIEEAYDPTEDIAPPVNYAPPAVPQATVRRADHPTIQLLEKSLHWHGISERLIKSLCSTAQAFASSKKGSIDDAEALLAEALAATLRFAPIQKIATEKPIMLVGTPGAGKTFAIAKIATDAMKRKAKLRIITTDDSRAAAYDQLAAFTQILGVQLDMADTPDALARSLAHAQGHEVLIDTAGCNPYRFEELKALGEMAKHRLIEPVLVLPLGIDAAEAQEIAGVFSFLDIERLLISRSDCARRFGGVIAAMETGDYALCNVSGSLRVADGCPPLTPETLAHLLLRPIRERTS